MFNISGQNINFVCGLVDKSLEVQINARRTYSLSNTNTNIVINMLFCIHKLCTWSLAETWFKVWEDAPRIFAIPSKMWNLGGGGGLTVFVNFNI